MKSTKPTSMTHSVCKLCNHKWEHADTLDIYKCPKCAIFTKEQLLQLNKIIQHSIDTYDTETHEVDYFSGEAPWLPITY